MYKNIVLGFEFELEGYDHDIYDLIENTSDITGLTDKHIHAYHSTRDRTLRGEWRVEEDMTIDGAEFISPPMMYEKAKTIAFDFLSAMKVCEGIKTTGSCGLHVGMSINHSISDIDIGGFLCGLNMQFIGSVCSNRFGEQRNGYCKNIGENLQFIKTFDIGDSLFDYEKVAKFILQFSSSFITIKHFNSKPYIELRTFGGKDYHKRPKDLFKLIDHVAYSMLNSKNYPRKKIAKKMVSYVNRVQTIKEKKDVINDYTVLSALDYLIYYVKKNGQYVCKNTLQNRIDRTSNVSYTLYNIIKYYAINDRKIYLKKLNETFNILQHRDIKINIPENESNLNKIKILKYWKMLPLDFVTDLITSLNKEAYTYFTKYYTKLPHNTTKTVLLNDILEFKSNGA